MQTIGFIGGDLRQLTLLEFFRRNGYCVKIYGYDSAEEKTENIDDIYKSDIIILPMPTCSSNKIYAPFYQEEIYINDLEFPCGKMIFYGGANALLEKKLLNSGSICVDYMKREELMIKNAVPTAEGAIEIAISETAKTIFGESVLVTGYGNVAKALARTLKALGADVTVAARKKSALAEACSCGYKSICISEIKNIIGEYELVFNTVPTVLFDELVLSSLLDDALLIDLASKPGGIDFDAAKKLKKRVIWALSLPGKTAPITAGEIIYETISEILSESGAI